MVSGPDQLQSHRYTAQRVVRALVRGDADPTRPPPGDRSVSATLAGLLIAVILLGAAAGYGAVTGTARIDWRDSAVVIVERESGARYVYRDDMLRPVHNYSSALLIAAAAPPRTVLVSQAALRGVRRGAPLGIPGAPDSLPPAEDLVDAQWTVCSGGQGPEPPTATAQPDAMVLVGGTVAAGRELGRDALLVRSTDGGLHLLWQGHRHLIEEPELVLSALGWSHHRPVPVPAAVVRAVPAGAGLVRPTLSLAGARSVAIPQAVIGEVFVVVTQSGSRQYAVADRTGLAAITQVQADLLLTAYDQAEPTVLTQGRFRELPRAAGLIPDGLLPPPATTPEVRPAATGVVCVRVAQLADAGPAAVAVRVDVDPAVVAPGVRLPPGRGALVQAVPPGGAARSAGSSSGRPEDDGPVSLITDAGLRYQVSDPTVLATLGYPDAVPVRLPAEVVELVPAGPDLDPRLALG
ncbi:type VII secretion protein EccB [Micromonospora sp. NBC_01813]|uniref:type VII secretion protein EccB n=1 Tax=Micromonospora sp. NBC_01813 TaxID=2975988 RepID=UPI002DDB0913|nr:type VII secretion protein EccB [Micromonospora sp. NBC_01813]WSA07900.1 type VII secretion protein EccB [Micromonospora sp. NBC_01813]